MYGASHDTPTKRALTAAGLAKTMASALMMQAVHAASCALMLHEEDQEAMVTHKELMIPVSVSFIASLNSKQTLADLH